MGNDTKIGLLRELTGIDEQWVDVCQNKHFFTLNAEEYIIDNEKETVAYVFVQNQQQLEDLIKEQLIVENVLKVKTMAEFQDFKLDAESINSYYQYVGQAGEYKVYKKEK